MLSWVLAGSGQAADGVRTAPAFPVPAAGMAESALALNHRSPPVTAFETETEPEPDDYDLSHAEWGFESAARQLVEACRANGVEPPAVAVVREADAACVPAGETSDTDLF